MPATATATVVMASAACVNNNIGISSDTFIDCPPAKFHSCDWSSPKMSFCLELTDDNAVKSAGEKDHVSSGNDEEEESDPEVSANEFEFRPDDPVNMLPADELFLDGKLVPQQLSLMRLETNSEISSCPVSSLDTPKLCRKDEISHKDPYLFSPRAPPTCSGRWKDLLSLKRFYQNSIPKQQEQQKTTSSSSSSSTNSHRSLKHFLHRSSKSSALPLQDSNLSLPLIKDSDCESVSVSSSRLSLSSSSSSSGHEHDDLPRLSLDSDKPNIHRNSNNNNPYRSRVSKVRTLSSENAGSTRTGRGTPARDPESNAVRVSEESPRMNSSGKIVFQSLERSSSSPSSCNGGNRYNNKHRGVERSYSGNVRFTPVLNVPVCYRKGSSSSSSKTSGASGGAFGIPLFSYTQLKKEGGGSGGGSAASSSGGTGTNGHVNRKNKSDR